jgi:hypothetical protein
MKEIIMKAFQTAMKSIATAMGNICKSAVTIENAKEAIKTSNATIKQSVEQINEVIPEAHNAYKQDPSVLTRFARRNKNGGKSGGAKVFMNFGKRTDGSSLAHKAEGSEVSLNQEFAELVKTKGSVESAVAQWLDVKNCNAYAVELLVKCLQAGLSIDDARQQVGKILECIEKNVPYTYGKDKNSTVINLGTIDLAKLSAKEVGEKTEAEYIASVAVAISDAILETACTEKQRAKAKNCKGRIKQASTIALAFGDGYDINVTVTKRK